MTNESGNTSKVVLKKGDPSLGSGHEDKSLVVHLSGIAGSGMSSLAGLFCARGDRVSGSDTAFHPPVKDVLAAMPAVLHQGYAADHIPRDVDLCVVGNIVSRGNPEAEAILNRHLPYTSMARALYDCFIHGKRSIVVAGTHGKTTTSAFIAFMLSLAGRKPGYFIGGRPFDLPAGYSPGQGEDFVSEGDEYETAFFDRSSKFLKYHPDILVLTPCEYDHVDFFPDEGAYRAAFANLVNQVPSEGRIIFCTDFEMNHQVVRRAFTPLTGYGAAGNPDLTLQAASCRPGGGVRFTLQIGNREMKLESPLAGVYNAGNLAAGVAVGMYLDIPWEVIFEAVSRFQGVDRRLRRLNRVGESHFYEDFAHHPTSLAGMLDSLRKMHPRHRLICLFEPRSRSLTRGDFQARLVESLSRADDVVIRRVAPAGKAPAEKRLDEERLAADLENRGCKAFVAPDNDVVKEWVLHLDFSQPVVLVAASNGAFGGIPQWLANLGAEEKNRSSR